MTCSYCQYKALIAAVWGCICGSRIWEAYACINHRLLFVTGATCPTCGKPLEILMEELPL